MYTTITFFKGEPSDNVKDLQVTVHSNDIYSVEDKGVSFDDIPTTIQNQQNRANNAVDIVCVRILGSHNPIIVVADRHADLFKKHFRQ